MVNGIRSLRKDETGIAYGLFGAFVLLLMGGAIYIYFSPIINSLINPFNIYIAQGFVSEATRNTVNFGVSIWAFLGIVIVFGIFGFIVVRAHEQREF